MSFIIESSYSAPLDTIVLWVSTKEKIISENEKSFLIVKLKLTLFSKFLVKAGQMYSRRNREFCNECHEVPSIPVLTESLTKKKLWIILPSYWLLNIVYWFVQILCPPIKQRLFWIIYIIPPLKDQDNAFIKQAHNFVQSFIFELQLTSLELQKVLLLFTFMICFVLGKNILIFSLFATTITTMVTVKAS